MKRKRPTPPIIDADELLRSIGIDPDEDFSDLVPENINAIPKDQWEPCTEVVIPAAIQRYLDSGDILTVNTIYRMEDAIAKAYGVEEPWYINATIEGTEEEGNLAVRKFMLKCETP